MALWILLLFVGSAQAVYYGSVMTYHMKRYSGPKDTYLVELHSKMTTASCNVTEWECLSGDCGQQISTTTQHVDPNSESDAFCQTETISTLQVPTDAPFKMRLDGGTQNWVENKNGVQFVRALTVVDIRSRSYQSQYNRPPQATIISPVRISSNCPRQIHLMAFDHNKDQVLCRYGKPPYECDPCSPPSVLYVSPTCTLVFNPTNSSSEGLYAVELVMEDYPRTNIYFYQPTYSDYINLVPFQFALNVTPPIPSCTEGEYLPKFVHPTPEHGTQLIFSPGEQLQIVIQAEATAATISGLLFSGPANVTEEPQGNGRFVLTWTSSVENYAETYPLCFVAQADVDSEVRCVILIYGLAWDHSGLSATGAALTYYHISTGTNDSVIASIRAKFKRGICFYSLRVGYKIYQELNCLSGDCGNHTLVGYFPVDNENNGEFCQAETIFTLTLPSNAPFEVEVGRQTMLVDLRTRSDTGRPNRAPMTTGPLTIRIPDNCEGYFKILAFDEDGDEVKIFSDYARGDFSCSLTTSFGTTFCSIPYTPTYYEDPNYHYRVIKDFPRQNIILTQTNGSQEVKTPKDAISKSEVSILLNRDGSALSCTEGVYLPKLLPPTPEFGAIVNATVGQTLYISIKAEANVSKVSELLFSGPHEMKKVMTGEGEFLLTWTPSKEVSGQSHPVCFVVDAVVGGQRFQSELRCVVVRVGEFIRAWF